MAMALTFERLDEIRTWIADNHYVRADHVRDVLEVVTQAQFDILQEGEEFDPEFDPSSYPDEEDFDAVWDGRADDDPYYDEPDDDDEWDEDDEPDVRLIPYDVPALDLNALFSSSDE